MVLDSLLSRFRNGVAIAKASFAVLRNEKWLLAFPVLYGVAWIVGLVGFVVGIAAALFGLAFLDQFVALSDGAGTVGSIVFLAVSFCFMVAATAGSTFFSAALVHSVGKLFAGEPTSLRDGLGGAWESRRTIFAWGIVGAIVGLIFRALESRDGLGAQLVRMTAGAAWFVMTFFIVPVIVFRDGGVRDSLGDSLSLFRETWGEVGGVTLGVGLVVGPFVALVAAVGIGAPLFLLENPGAVLLVTAVPSVVVIALLVIVYNAATGIAKTALYRYATDGALPAEFDGIDPDAITRARRGSSGTMGGPSGGKPGQI